jgi:RNA polymerase sigma-70 factor (ECF subfamily)
MSASQEPIYTESELIAALKKRDQSAFTYLYQHYRGALYQIILQFIPREEIAGDLLQEVFVTIWKQIDKYDPQKGRLFTWMHTIARNSSINAIRSKSFLQEQKNQNTGDLVSKLDNQAHAQQNINLIGLRKEVHELRNEYKLVIELSYYQGLTHEEISKVLDIPLGTVKSRLRNGLIELRKSFT